jgi:hypothetical protein
MQAHVLSEQSFFFHFHRLRTGVTLPAICIHRMNNQCDRTSHSPFSRLIVEAICHVTHCWEADHSIDLSPACQTQERNIHPFCWLEVASLLINSSIICPKPNASIYLSPLFFRVQKIRIFSLALSNKFPIGLQLYLARINSILNCNKLGHLSNRDFVAGLSHNAWWVLWFRKEKWRNGWISSVSF